MAAILISGCLAQPSSLSLPLSPKLHLSNCLSQKSHWVSLRRSTQAFNRRFSKTFCLYTSGNQPDDKGSGPKWPILRRWNVPWNWQTISLSSLACGISITTVVVLGVLYTLTKSSKPLCDEIYRYDWREPLNLQQGWLLWAIIGLVGALIAIGLTGAAMSFLNSEPPQREAANATVHPAQCLCFCCCTSNAWRISSAFCTRDCSGILICSNTESSYTNHNSRLLELRGYLASDLPPASRI